MAAGTRVRRTGSKEEQVIGMHRTTSEVPEHEVSEDEALAQALPASNDENRPPLSQRPCQIASLEKCQL